MTSDGFSFTQQAIMGAQPLGGGVLVPTPITYRDGPLTVVLEVHEERLVATSVTVECAAKVGGVRTDQLRKVSLPDIRKRAVLMSSWTRDGPGRLVMAAESALPDQVLRSVVEQAAATPRPRRRRRNQVMGPEQLGQVVQVWQQGGRRAVVEDYGVSDRTVYRWIDQARQLGLIAEGEDE